VTITGTVAIVGDVSATGKLTVGGQIDPTGYEATPQSSDPTPGSAYGLWIDDTNHQIQYSEAGVTKYWNTDRTRYSATGDVSAADNVADGDATSGAITLTIPTAAVGRLMVLPLRLAKIDSSANFVTVAVDGSGTINGATTQILTTQYQAFTLVAMAEGVGWRLG